MPYTINYMINDRIEWTDHWPDTLETAQAVGKEAVEAGTAERIEIRDEQGAAVFHYPRTLHRA